MSDGEFLYVFDGSSSTLRRMSLADATVDTIAGAHGQVATVDGAAASARLGIVNDAVLVGHAIYFTQRENHVLRKVSLEPATLGQISTVVGTLNTPGSDDGDAASALLNQPLALAAIGAKIYIADTGNNVIRAFDTVTLKVATVAGTAGACAGAVDGATATFCNVSSLTSDNDGYLYALDNYQTTVRKIRASDGWTSTFLGTIGQRRDDGAGPLPTAMYPASLEFVPGLGLLVTAQGGLSVRLIK